MDCPQCGAQMVAEPLPDEREIVKSMFGRGSSNAYAANKAATMKEKEAALGVVVVCSNCRYVTRAKDGAVEGQGAPA